MKKKENQLDMLISTKEDEIESFRKKFQKEVSELKVKKCPVKAGTYLYCSYDDTIMLVDSVEYDYDEILIHARYMREDGEILDDTEMIDSCDYDKIITPEEAKHKLDIIRDRWKQKYFGLTYEQVESIREEGRNEISEYHKHDNEAYDFSGVA